MQFFRIIISPERQIHWKKLFEGECLPLEYSIQTRADCSSFRCNEASHSVLKLLTVWFQSSYEAPCPVVFITKYDFLRRRNHLGICFVLLKICSHKSRRPNFHASISSKKNPYTQFLKSIIISHKRWGKQFCVLSCKILKSHWWCTW
jgi:hypothetical protein